MCSATSEKIPSGIEGLDDVLLGGFISNRSYLLTGPTGSGKTIFSIQWLLEGLKNGESCLYITFTEPPHEIARNLASFGWDLSNLPIVDPVADINKSHGGDEEYQIFSPEEVEQLPLWEVIYDKIEERKPQRLVIDSATYLRFLSIDEFQFRKRVFKFVDFLRSIGCTSILAHEPIESNGDLTFALAVDGIIKLRRDISSGRVIELRTLEVQKFRGSNYLDGLHPMRIASGGIVVFPHIVEKRIGVSPGEELVASGVEELDEILMGGIESGTTTIISGPTGVGKTTLGIQFLVNSASAGVKSVMYTFEESIESIVRRCRGIGIALDEAINSGRIIITKVNPMELYPDELLNIIRKTIEKDKVELVLIDSLRGYHLAMEQFGTLVSHLQNIVTYLNNRNITTFIVNEVEHITGDLTITELGVSFLVDNIILIRYAEINSEVRRIIGCLKKRLGPFKPELREFEITGAGIVIGKKLQGMKGVLTGVPEK